METKFQTSFIPKKPIAPHVPIVSKRAPVRVAPNLFLVVAVTIVFCVGLAYGGVYLYVEYLKSQVATLSKSLDEKVAQFNIDFIAELEVMSDKIKIGESVLSSHLSPAALFNILEDLTVSNVRYNKFALNSSANTVSISLNGEATSYGALAVQSDVVYKTPYFHNLNFSGFNLSKSGTVLFTLDVQVDPSAISASRNAVQAAPVEVSPEEPAS